MDRKLVDLDLNAISRSFEKCPALVSLSGSDPNFSVYQHALISHFSRNPAVWKRNNKIFPHRICFPLKFISFDEKQCFGPHVTPEDINKTAFLHIFNINVTTAEEYRSQVRHNVSDWFATLNSKSDVQWIIVVNTTRAKDKKTKTAIIDKIKSDFSKFHSRLFELPDTSDHSAFVAFVQGIQQCLFSHLNLIMEVWDRSLRGNYEKRKQHYWDPYAYLSSLVEYGRIHWSFGAIEFAISIFDDLEKLFQEFIGLSYEPDSPKWLSQMLDVTIEDPPSLIQNFGQQMISRKEAHYLGIRNFLLCQQIVMAIHLYQHKMKSNDAAPSLRSDCAIDILRRTLVAIEGVKEFNGLMGNTRDIPKTNCWIWWTVSESISICSLLCDISHLNIAPAILAKLHLARFEAILGLAQHVKSNKNEGDALNTWLQGGSLKGGGGESKKLARALESIENMAQEMERSHDICVSALLNANRHRTAVLVTYRLFEFLRSCDLKCPIQKLQLGPSVLKHLPCQPTTAKMLKCLAKEYIEQESVQNDEILSLLFFIIRCEGGVDAESIEKFLGKCQNSNLNSICNDDLLFKFRLEPFDAMQTPDSKFVTKCHVDSRIGFALKNARIRLHFSACGDANVAHNRDLSVLSLQYDKKENICRLVAEHRMKRGVASGNAENLMVFEIDSQEFELKPGTNTVTLTSEIDKIGVFVLEKVSVHVGGLFHFETCHVDCNRPPVMYCIATPHAVTITNDSQPFMAGVIQKVEIEVEARCDIPRDTSLLVLPSSPLFKFLDVKTNEWIDEVSLNVEPIKSMEKRRMSVFVWLKIDSTICESAAVQKRSLIVEWMNLRYSLPISFMPIMVITSKTSMMTTDILLEMEVNRAAGSNISTIISEASLEATDIAGNSHSAERLTRTPVVSDLLSVTNFVWKLPVKGSLVTHRVRLDYTAKFKNDVEYEGMEMLKYSFEDDIELSVPEVKCEICTQVLSQQPGAQLCRATSPCHLVISIRCLDHTPCSLFVVLDADERMWTLAERTKLVTVKESGLGQLALSIIPVVAGYLPFPSVSIYECQTMIGSTSDAVIPGPELLCFNRTGGKQIRVLSANNSENSSTFGKENRNSSRIAKKLVKLFD